MKPKLGKARRARAARDSYLFLRILESSEDLVPEVRGYPRIYQKTEIKCSTGIFVPGVIGIHVKTANLKFVDQSNF